MQESHDIQERDTVINQPVEVPAEKPQAPQGRRSHRGRRGVLLVAMVVVICFIAGFGGMRV